MNIYSKSATNFKKCFFPLTLNKEFWLIDASLNLQEKHEDVSCLLLDIKIRFIKGLQTRKILFILLKEMQRIYYQDEL